MDAIEVIAALPRDPFSHAPRLWQPSDVRVELRPTHCRRPNAEVDAAVDAEWAAKRRAHPNVELFNALKFRLAGLEVGPEPATRASTSDGARCAPPFDVTCGPAAAPLTLHIGLTDYKSNVATNATVASGHDGTHLSAAGPATANWATKLERADVSDAIGVEALVLTSDDHVLLFRRSHRVAECPGYYCGPGGHAEPFRVVAALRNATLAKGEARQLPALRLFDAACERISDAAPASQVAAWCRAWCRDPDTGDAHTVMQEASPPAHPSHTSTSDSSQPPPAVAAAERLIAEELFFSAREEVADELGLPLQVVDMCGLAGVVRVPRHNGKPIAVFVVRLRGVDAAAATAAFELRRAEASSFEADGGAPFVALPLAQAAAVVRVHEGHVQVGGGSRVPITPGTVGCLALGLPAPFP